jgi:hypothetical protein
MDMRLRQGVAVCGLTFVGVVACVSLSSCERPGCTGASLDEACTVPSPCLKLSFSCPENRATVSVFGRGDAMPGGLSALASVGDVLLQNDQVSAVIDALDHPHFIAPSGGSLLDLGTRGGDNDSINNVFQATGLLPWDAVVYTQMFPIQGADFAAVQVRGHLDGRPNVIVSTRYELRACEPGLRVRTEIRNGEADADGWTLTDGYFWGDRENAPFIPYPGAGFLHPSFGLSEINDVFRDAPYLAASHHSEPSATYATVACDRAAISGFHSEFVTAAGTPRTVVQPRDHLIFERFIAVAPGRALSAGTDIALELRRQLHGEAWVSVSGNVLQDGRDPVQNLRDEARLSLLFVQGSATEPRSKRIPWTQTTVASDGRFSVRLPANRNYTVVAEAFGRQIAEVPFTVGAQTTQIPPFPIPAVGAITLQATVDGSPDHVLVIVEPADTATRDAVKTKLHGAFATCAPLLGAPNGPSPACNKVLLDKGATTVAVPPGRYDIFATNGPFSTVGRQTVTVSAGTTSAVSFSLERLPVLPLHTLSADFHVHGSASEDSAIPDRDRVRAFLASGAQVIVSTEHDVVSSYSAAIAALSATNRLVLITGTESTGHILFRYVPGDTIPRVVGHFNFWPVTFDPTAPWRGAAWDELAEPGMLMTRMQAAGWSAETGVAQMNHPWGESAFGRDFGFAHAIGLKANQSIKAEPNTKAGVFDRVPVAAKFRNSDYHAQEVMNGTENERYLQYRSLWFSLLNQGVLRAGTANSDSHGLSDNILGTPRNVVSTSSTVLDFDPIEFNAAVRAGKMIGTNGPVVTAAVVEKSGAIREPSLLPFVPTSDAVVHIVVQAAPWVPVDELRAVVNGKVVQTWHKELAKPGDPLGRSGIERLVLDVPLASLLPAGDAWLVFEAGSPLPPVADLDCDGVMDTGDNNGDGIADWRDVDRNDDDVVDAKEQPAKPPTVCRGPVGPLHDPPKLEPGIDPLYIFSVVTHGARPTAFTNPFVLNRDGGAFVPGAPLAP